MIREWAIRVRQNGRLLEVLERSVTRRDNDEIERMIGIDSIKFALPHDRIFISEEIHFAFQNNFVKPAKFAAHENLVPTVFL